MNGPGNKVSGSKGKPRGTDVVHQGRNTSIRGASDGNRSVIEYREGPLPDPEALARYEAICPGAADRIISMAEHQSAHRQNLESLAIPAGIRAERFGQVNGLIVSLAGLGTTVALAAYGADAAASVVGGSTILGLASVFILGRFMQGRERGNNSKR